MIDAKDLRIGNYIHYLYYKETKSLPTTVAAGTFIDLINHPEYYEPIPLSSELLEKCGFVYRKRWEHDLLANYIYQAVGFYMNDVVPEIKYLHQLQNIFFCLSGEELKIDL